MAGLKLKYFDKPTHHLPFKHNGLELPNKHIQLKRHVYVFYVSSPPKAQAPARDPYDAIQSQTMHQETCRSKLEGLLSNMIRLTPHTAVFLGSFNPREGTNLEGTFQTLISIFDLRTFATMNHS